MRRAESALGAFAAAVIAVCAGAPLSSARAAPLPPGFFGVVPQAPLTARDLTRMKGVVGTLRIPIYWSECESAPGVYDFATLDTQIEAAAEVGIRVQPFVYGTPSWLAPSPALPPLSRGAKTVWTAFLRSLVRRYGPGGDFWHGRSRQLPIRIWQIWNEPNFVLFWKPGPNPRDYAKLLRLSTRAIRAVDPRARIALAGVAPVNAGLETWVFLRRLLRIAGVPKDFDFVALHPYSSTLPGFEYQVRRVRRAMAHAGLGSRSLLISEIGVASKGVYPSPFVKGLDGQAEFLRAAYERILEFRHRWRIGGVDWFTWRDAADLDPHCAFCEGAGLFDVEDHPKLAWFAYRHAVTAARLR